MTTPLEELPRSDIVDGALHPSQTPVLSWLSCRL